MDALIDESEYKQRFLAMKAGVLFGELVDAANVEEACGKNANIQLSLDDLSAIEGGTMVPSRAVFEAFLKLGRVPNFQKDERFSTLWQLLKDLPE